MNNIIKFPFKSIELEAKDFDLIITRLYTYLDFLNSEIKEEHKEMYANKIYAVLKFLGDYKLDDDIFNGRLDGDEK